MPTRRGHPRSRTRRSPCGLPNKHAGRLRYVDVWGRWLTWDGTRWQFDDTLAAYDLVRETCRTASAECNRENIAAALASAKTVAAVERLARSDRRLAATVDQWDRDPWLLNTPGGIVDLRQVSGRPIEPTPTDENYRRRTAMKRIQHPSGRHSSDV